MPPGYADMRDLPALLSGLRAKFGGDPQLVSLDDGMVTVVDGAVPRRWGAVGHQLAAEVRPTQAAEVAAHLSRQGEVLVGWEPHHRRAVAVRLPPFEAQLVARLVTALRLDGAWQLGDVAIRFDGDGLAEVILFAPPTLATGSDSRRERWRDVTQAVVGHEGWRVSVDETSGVVTMRAGARSALPDRAGFDWSAVREASVDQLPFATDGHGGVLTWSLGDSPHAMVSGPTGSGKAQPLGSRLPVPVSENFPKGWTSPTRSHRVPSSVSDATGTSSSRRAGARLQRPGPASA